MNSQNINFVAYTLLALTLIACSKTDSTESRDELAARAGAPLFAGMGSHEHPVTTAIPEAQLYFDQGLVIDFAFNHAESVR